MGGKGRALLAACVAREHDVLLIEAPLLCAARPGARHACGVCLGDAEEYCESCDEGYCAMCGPHAAWCPMPDESEKEFRQSVWYRLYSKYVSLLLSDRPDSVVRWDAFARVPTTVYSGWDKFADVADRVVQPLSQRYAAVVIEGGLAAQALTAAGFLDFYLLARANT